MLQNEDGGGEESSHILNNIRNFLRNLQSNQDDTNVTDMIDIDIEEDLDIVKGFQDIPINNQLKILSYLDVLSLCRAAQVCTLWTRLTEDPVLWETKLKIDSCNWHVIDHLTHPDNYRTTCPNLTPKEIYIKCCPEYRNEEGTPGNSLMRFSKIRNLLGLSIPRIVMFGSGLNDTGLVSRIMLDTRSPFTVNGMFPGRFEGIGSGVSLQHQDGTINLIALYGLPKAERERGLVDSKLLVEDGESSGGVMTLTQPVKQLCATINSFIYVVDCRPETFEVTFRKEEFTAMIDDRWLQANARVLVLCIVPDATDKSITSLNIANKLDMVNLARPWQVRQCHVQTLYGFMPGLKWVTAHV